TRNWLQIGSAPSDGGIVRMDAAPGFAVPSSSRRLRARRMADQLLALLERQIDEGRIKPGERLAPERELAAQFGASRNVVRAALAELHKAGKITRRVGHGTVVVAPAEAPRVRAPLQLLDASPVELLEFRLRWNRASPKRSSSMPARAICRRSRRASRP